METIQKVPLLRTLPIFKVVGLVRVMHLRTYEPGVTIIQQGDIGSDFFILHTGTVKVVKDHSKSRAKVLADLEEGSYFGERALVKHERRNASIIATSSVVCYSLAEEDFHRIVLPHAQDKLEKEKALRSMLIQLEGGAVSVDVDIEKGSPASTPPSAVRKLMGEEPEDLARALGEGRAAGAGKRRRASSDRRMSISNLMFG